MATTPRRRSRQQSPTTMIVNFFLDSPLAVAQDALAWAQALVARRKFMDQEKDELARWHQAKVKELPLKPAAPPLPDHAPHCVPRRKPAC